MIRKPTTGRDAIVLGLVTVASVVAVAGLRGVFLSWSFLWPAVVGSATAAVVGLAARRWALLLGEAAVVAVVALVVVGIVVVGADPGVFFRGLVGAWSDLLTATEPAALTAELRIVPFALAWIGTTVGSELGRWTRMPSLPTAGPLAALALTLLLGDLERPVALGQGAALAAVALLIGAVQQGRPGAGAQDRGAPRTRTAIAGAVVAVAALVAPVLGPRLPLAGAHQRVTLRDRAVPPWNGLSVPSPLTTLKGSLAEARREQVVFTVTAPQPISRWQLAVLGNYDGTVWTVASGGASPSAEFRPVDSRVPLQHNQGTATVSATVTVASLGGPWLPTPGAAVEVRLDNVKERLRANLATGTLALTSGLPAGLTYQIRAVPRAELTDEQLAGSVVRAQPARENELDGLPQQVTNLSADLLQGMDIGWGQVVAVRDALRLRGFYAADGRTPPGHSYYNLARFLADPQRLVGYEEQYAAAAAVAMRVALLPARVVVGYLIPDQRWTGGRADVLAGDISAWVEVNVDGYGWVPVDVTPPRSRTPQQQQQGTTVEDVAVAVPPPPPQLPPQVEVVNGNDEEPPEEEPDEPEPDSDDVSTGWSAGRWVAAGSAGTGALGLLLATLIIAWKALRSRRRRTAPQPAERIAGAWNELADRCAEAGLTVPTRATPHEIAARLVDAEGEDHRDDLSRLADDVDRAAFHPDPPSPDAAEQAWGYCDRVVSRIRANRSPARRALMRVDPRPLGHRDRLSRGAVRRG